MAEAEKIKLLCLFDYACSTGFATVSSNIMRELYKDGGYDADIVAINAVGDPYNRQRFPFNVYPAVTIKTIAETGGSDAYGRNKFLSMLRYGDYDLIFIIQDSFIVQTIMSQMLEIIEAKTKRPKTIFYYPIDAPPKKEWISEAVAKFDYAVPYTRYAYIESIAAEPSLSGKLNQPIYHGTNLKEFYYIEDRQKVAAFRHTWFNDGYTDDKFLLLNVNRNQPRKDILRCFSVLRVLRDLGDEDTLLYLHMQATDAGGNLLDQAKQLGLEIGRDYVMPTPQIFNSNRGVPPEILNQIYNAADCLITTTHGEGWGLSITEAYATRTPVVCPDNTSMTEMGAENRAKLVDSGDKPEAWIVKQDDNDRLRPIVNVEKFAKAILEIKSGKGLPDIDEAYAFVHNHSWKNICEQWRELFNKAAQQSRVENSLRLRNQDRKNFKKHKSKKQRRKERVKT